MKTDLDAVRALPAKWRAEAEAKDDEGDYWQGHYQRMHMQSAADELEAALSTQPAPSAPTGPRFTNTGDSEAQFIADGERLNCPTCGGSGHVEDALSAPSEQVAAHGVGVAIPATAEQIEQFVAQVFPPEQVAASVAVPEGYVLVPAQMALSPDDVANFVMQVTNDPDAEDTDDRYAGATLVVGRIALDGEETDAEATGPYGLHVYNPDYPDEGCVTLFEFAAAPVAPEREG